MKWKLAMLLLVRAVLADASDMSCIQALAGSGKKIHIDPRNFRRNDTRLSYLMRKHPDAVGTLSRLKKENFRQLGGALVPRNGWIIETREATSFIPIDSGSPYRLLRTLCEKQEIVSATLVIMKEPTDQHIIGGLADLALYRQQLGQIPKPPNPLLFVLVWSGSQDESSGILLGQIP